MSATPANIRVFATPANIKDFDVDSELAIEWDKFLSERFQEEISSLQDIFEDSRPEKISFYDPRDPPGDIQLYQQVTWLGFPNTMIIAMGLEEALKKSENPEEIKVYVKKGESFEEISFLIRSNQDEYLEWSVQRDEETGKIKEIIFTCEGPEYWETISRDKELLLKLYQKLCGAEVKESDLFHTDDVFERIKIEGEDHYIHIAKKGEYNIWNRWNVSHAIHLHQRNNSLSAEINIAARATILRKKDDPVIDAHSLICCSGFGGPNRNSDPTIGDAVNAQVRSNRWISLRQPIGVYISDIDSSGFEMPDGSPILDFKERYWNVIRGDKEGNMILRVVLRVPEGELFQDRQFVLEDLLLNGVPLRCAGQVANNITIGLFATVIERPSMDKVKVKILPCPRMCCPNLKIPGLNIIKYYDEECEEELKLALRKIREIPFAVNLRKIDELPYEIFPSKTRY